MSDYESDGYSSDDSSISSASSITSHSSNGESYCASSVSSSSSSSSSMYSRSSSSSSRSSSDSSASSSYSAMSVSSMSDNSSFSSKTSITKDRSIMDPYHGYRRNQHGNFFKQGSAHSIATKLMVAEEYKKAYAESFGDPSINEIAKTTGYSWSFVKKVESELQQNGRIVDPVDIRKEKDVKRGPGAHCLDEEDRFVLLMLYLKEPSRTLGSYRDRLFDYTDRLVSKATISRYFLDAFPVKGGLCKPNLVPFDKFRPRNIEKAMEYCQILARFDPSRIKFGDEKLLKGQHIYCRRTRRNVLTGNVPAMSTNSDLRNTYTLTGFCGIDKRVSPVFCRIHDESNDSEQFALDIELVIRERWLLPGNVLVLDNWTGHSGGINSNLEEWLWNSHEIFLLFLPARTPEWNPMELVWNNLTTELQLVPLSIFRESSRGNSAIPDAAHGILENITHRTVKKFYKKCLKLCK